MSKQSRFALPERLRYVFFGAVLGAVWGVILWALADLGGDNGGVRSLGYLVLTTAMLGGGVAAVFGAVRARRRGERVHPRSPYRRRR